MNPNSSAELNGLSVLVTRPQPKAQVLIEAISAIGGRSIHLPTLRIHSVQPGIQEQSYIEHLDQYKAVICVSSHAAHYGLELLADRWPQWPVGMHWVAVGKATAEVFDPYLLQASYPSSKQSDSTGMLDLPQLSQDQIRGEKVLIIRGRGGLEILSEGLTQRGAKVEFLEAYERVCPAADEVSEALTEIQTNGCDLVTAYSGESLENLISLLKTANISYQSFPVLAISDRVAQIARDIGFLQVETVRKGLPVTAQVVSKDVDSVVKQQPSAKSDMPPVDQNFFNSIRSWYAALPKS